MVRCAVMTLRSLSGNYKLLQCTASFPHVQTRSQTVQPHSHTYRLIPRLSSLIPTRYSQVTDSFPGKLVCVTDSFPGKLVCTLMKE